MATAMEVQTTERGGRSPLLVKGEKMAASGMWITPGQDAMPIHFVGHAEKDFSVFYLGQDRMMSRTKNL